MPKANKPPAPPPSPAPSATRHLFGGRKPDQRAASVTSERIASDLETFRKAGGRIEVLGVTRSLTRIGNDAATAPPVAARPPTKPRR
jgi:hypothetical protein